MACLRCHVLNPEETTCTHAALQCPPENTLFLRAYNNTELDDDDGTKLKNLYQLVTQNQDLSQKLLVDDPSARFNFPTDKLHELDKKVPQSLLTLMKKVGLVNSTSVKCWVCNENATLFHVACAAKGCKKVAHPACLRLQVHSVEELQWRVTERGQFFCEAVDSEPHKMEEFVFDPAKADRGAEPCELGCDSPVSVKNDYTVQCADPGCTKVFHFKCMYLQFRGGTKRTDIETFLKSGACTCKEHAVPLFVGVPDADVDPRADVMAARNKLGLTRGKRSSKVGAAPTLLHQVLVPEPEVVSSDILKRKRQDVDKARNQKMAKLKDILPYVRSYKHWKPVTADSTDSTDSTEPMVILLENAKVLVDTFFAIATDQGKTAFETRLPSSGGLLGVDALRYVVEGQRMGDDVALFRAVLRATLPTSADDALKQRKEDQSLDTLYEDICAQHKVAPLSTISVATDLHQLLTDGKAEDLLSNRDCEYDRASVLTQHRRELLRKIYQAAYETDCLDILTKCGNIVKSKGAGPSNAPRM